MTNTKTIDIEQLDDAFQYARDIAFSVQKQLSIYARRPINPSREKQLLILYRATCDYFTIEQIWERLNKTEQNLLSGELTATEVLALTEAGYDVFGDE